MYPKATAFFGNRSTAPPPPPPPPPVGPPLTVSISPSSQVAFRTNGPPGSGAVFAYASANHNGTGPFAYQWYGGPQGPSFGTEGLQTAEFGAIVPDNSYNTYGIGVSVTDSSNPPRSGSASATISFASGV